MNFLRKAIPQIQASLNRKGNERFIEVIDWVCDRAVKAEKFVMPNGGQIFDSGLKALPDKLNLPFPEIVLEYFCVKVDGGRVGDGLASEILGEEFINAAPKRIVYACQKDVGIAVFSLVETKFPSEQQTWLFMPFGALVSKKHNVTIHHNPLEGINKPLIEGVTVAYQDFSGLAIKKYGDDWEKYAAIDLNDEIMAVLSLLEALSCKNVSTEKLPTRKLNKGAQKRGVLDFDEYHVLTINRTSTDVGVGLGGGSHRSPREHLRRGHIRRLPHGNIWVNSTVVNPNVGGKINKVYELQGEIA
jgi:hypothetical protein